MDPNKILWIYILLLIGGGLLGFAKAKSKASLIASLSFGAALILCAVEVVFRSYVADILLTVLLVFFGVRYARSKKFMPAGIMTILTVITLALRNM